tara:strand:+ start:382 stop:567 length:186 start_codon:yes stop_codon:yes gene_type:complete
MNKLKLEDMNIYQLEEYIDRLRVANHKSGRLDLEEERANQEWRRRDKAWKDKRHKGNTRMD